METEVGARAARPSQIEEPDYAKAPKPAYPHWSRGDLTLEQAEAMFPIGATVRFFRGGGRLMGGMTGRVVQHSVGPGEPTTRFGGRARIHVALSSESDDAARGALGSALGVGFGRLPVQKVSEPFRSCEVVSNA